MKLANCRQMIQYSNGERRVIDLETMTASEFLTHDDCDQPLGAYELDHDLDSRDLDPDFQVIRSEESEAHKRVYWRSVGADGTVYGRTAVFSDARVVWVNDDEETFSSVEAAIAAVDAAYGDEGDAAREA